MTALWDSALRTIQEKIAEPNYEMWLRPIECLDVNESNITLRAPNPYVRLWFESNYLPVILGEIHEQTGINFDVSFSEDASPESPDLPKAEVVYPTAPPAAEAIPQSYASQRAEGSDRVTSIGAAERPHLNPKYTFDAFVSGPSNQLARAAAEAAANHYPPKYNPIFICGGVGLGKTHLMHAVATRVLETRPDSHIVYITGEQFMNAYVQAIRSNEMQQFRDKFRNKCDLLLVDDVQFLAGKGGTQDEFFHTFNALHDSHRQIVVTADRKPFEIADIADRLRSRFAWGLMADVDTPELEVRVAILRKKAQSEGITLTDDIAMYIASNVHSNIRELEGALIRLAAFASLSNTPITLEFAEKTLAGSMAKPMGKVTIEGILKAVAQYYNVKTVELKSTKRHKSIAGPRAVAMYLARTHTNMSYPDLGRAFGGKHHTTIMSAVEKIEKKLMADLRIRSEVQSIESTLFR